MHFLRLSTLLLWTLLTTLYLTTLAHPTSTSSSHTKRCTNALQNPSFEAGISPYLTMVSGSFTDTRGVYTSPSGGHSGANFFYALSNATVDATLTLSQSGIPIAAGGQVECAAWVASSRPGNVGSTRVEVFLDGKSCGMAYLGTTGWTRVGGKVGIEDTGMGSEGHTFAVVVISDEAGVEGWSVWVDDLVVGVGC